MNNERNNKKEAWIEDVLSSVDGLQRVPSNPFLYTRIHARIREANSTWERTARFITKPAFAFAIILVILIINVWVAFQHQNNANSHAKINTMEAEMLFAAEYSNMQNYSLIDPNDIK
jgi:hypothetical protein